MNCNNLKHLISLSGKMQKDISNDLNINRQRFNNYVTGIREPDVETLALLAKYFNVSIDYLTGNTDSTELDIAEYPTMAKYRALERRGKEIVDHLLDELYAEEKENAPTAYSDERIDTILQNRPELTELANQIRMLDGEQTLKAIDYIQYLLTQQDKN